MKQFISYRVDLMYSTAKGKYSIFINPIRESNIKANNISGKRRFYCNERAYRLLKEFFDEQWKNNLESE